MDKKEKILGMLQLLDLNDDLFRYEMTSLAKKINNFLDDRSRLLSGKWLDVMYVSLTDESADEKVEIGVSNILDKVSFDLDDNPVVDFQDEYINEINDRDSADTVKIDTIDELIEAYTSSEDNRCAIEY